MKIHISKHSIFIFCLVLVLILFLFISLFPFGTKKYKINNYEIEVPRMMMLVEKNKNMVKFRTFRDYRMLKKDVDKVLEEFTTYKEKNKTHYFDKKQGIYIKEYKVKKGFFMNEVIIKLEG